MITLITDRLICKDSLLVKIEELIDEKRIDQIILREKDLDDKKLYYLYLEIEKILKNTHVKLIVNTSLAFVKKYDLKRIHLSQRNFKRISSKKELKDLFFGISVHSMNEIRSALKFEPDYLLVSPVFKTDCKKDKKPLGIGFLKKVQSMTNIPLIALGGINDKNINQLKQMNISNTAMRSNLLL